MATQAREQTIAESNKVNAPGVGPRPVALKTGIFVGCIAHPYGRVLLTYYHQSHVMAAFLARQTGFLGRRTGLNCTQVNSTIVGIHAMEEREEV
jgi:hypothetical protein